MVNNFLSCTFIFYALFLCDVFYKGTGLQPTKQAMLSPHRGSGVQQWPTVASSVVCAACCLHGLPYRTLATALSSGHSCLTSCHPQYRVQGSLGKSQATVARVHTGQIMSTHTKVQNKERGQVQVPWGCQKIHISKKWGFTHFNAQEFEAMMAEKQFISNDPPPSLWGQIHP